MLVLARKAGQSIVIEGGRIRVQVTEIRDGKVRLGFTCSREVTVDREEIHQLKEAAHAGNRNQESAA